MQALDKKHNGSFPCMPLGSGTGGTASSAPLSGARAGTPGSECWDSLSYLESAFHHGFMRSRLKTGDFVYHENARVTRALDEFCDVDAMHQSKGPIILMGESGVGKSTFLANWLVRRKKMFQNWQSSYPEFIFHHVVGCSRQSLYVSNLLERILREIKEHFELNKEIPEVEERLSWQFPRFLEAASKKGRIIVIIDGLQRLRTTDGESILKWMPLAFPPNVRLIFSGTVGSPATNNLHLATNLVDGHALPNRPGIQIIDQFERPSMNAQLIERIKLEANRRNWTILTVPSLLEEERVHLVKKFLQKYPPSRVVQDQKPASDDVSTPTSLLAAHGLQMFDLQQRAIVSVPMSASPQFLETILTAIAWGVNEGFNIHSLFSEWLTTDSYGQLLEAILRTMEVGHTPNEQTTADARQFLRENRSTVAADGSLSPQRRNTGLNGGDHLIHDTTPNGSLAIPEFSKSIQSSLELRFGEISSPDNSNGRRELQRRQSQHETTEVFVRSLGARSADRKKSIIDVAALPGIDGHRAQSSASDISSQIATSSTAHTAALNPSQHAPSRAPPPVANPASTCDKILSRKNIASMPPYLTGGLYVRPLGDLLGRALSLLYVSRHGLLERELKFILNAVVNEARQNAAPSQKLHRKSSFGNVKNLSTESVTAFTEADWKALLRAFKGLGILFVQDVLVLPICKEALRDGVWWRYIGSERAEQQYHQWLIRFFRIHPTTFRRVEELPWHLKRCYQWDSLCAVLVNLPMFQLLYTANYKVELFGYWRLLIDGPLPLYSATDTTTELVYSTVFDVVKEYGRSVEEWYKSAKPTTKAFTAMVQLVTKFMYEFSVYYQGFLPTFNHAPFDLTKMHADGFTFAEDLPHVQQITTSSSAMNAAAASSGGGLPPNATTSSMGMTAASAAATALTTALDAFLTLNQQTATNVVQKDKESNGNWFYYYQRWIWIHYPWLALGKEIVLREPHVDVVLPGRGSKMSGGGQATTQLTIATGDPSLSLLSSSGVASDMGDDEGQCDANTTPAGVAGPGTVSQQSASDSRAQQFEVRFWDVKKSLFDPVHQQPKGSMSPTKVRALQNSSVLSGGTPSMKTERLISPENLFRKKSTYAAVKNVLASSVRTLPGTFSASTPALPALPESGRQPTFLTDALPEDKNPLSLDGGALHNTSLSKPGPLSSLGARDMALLRQMTRAESVGTLTTAFGLPAHFQDYPQSEWDMRKSYNYELLLKLQTLYDNAKLEVKKKQSHLQAVKHKISETHKRYELAMRECEMAKNAIDEMHARMDKIEHMLKQIDRQEKTHRKLLRSCEVFPPTDSSHFETIKKEFKLLQMKLKDLVEEKKALQIKKSHLQSVEVPILQREINRNKELMSAVVDKLERAREKIAHDQSSTDKLYQRRMELIENVRSTSSKSATPAEASTLESEVIAVAQHTASASTRSLAAKVALQQCESMCEKIQKATGYSKLEQILEKFVSREELNRSFEEQAKVYDARLNQIKLHHAELEQQLKELEMSNAVVTVEDPRLLEEKLRVAEVELARTERTQSVLLTTSKEVIAGASRIVKLMGITSCRMPHQNAIPAMQLWPPPVRSEDSAMSSEFEALKAKDIANLLQICQDRASRLIDVIQGGRVDPDANFSTTGEPGGRTRRTKEMGGGAKPGGRGKRGSRVAVRIEKATRERGSLLGVAVPDPAIIGGEDHFGSIDVSISVRGPLGTHELDEDDKNLDVLTRDAIKVASKAKTSQKKRAKDPAAGVDTDFHE